MQIIQKFLGQKQTLKGQAIDFTQLFLGVFVLGVLTIVLVQILSGMQSGFTSNSLPYNITNTLLNAIKTFSDNFGTIFVVLGAVIILSFVYLLIRR